MGMEVVAEAVQAVAEVLLVVSFGVYLGWNGVLDNTGIKRLEKVIVGIFTPSLIIAKVIPQANWARIVGLWPLISVCPWNMFWGCLFGYILTRFLLRCPQNTGVVQAALSFPNTISVCLTLANVLARAQTVQELTVAQGNVPNGTDTEIGSQGLEDFLLSRSSVYVLTSTVWWNFARWTVGYNLLCYDAGESWASRMQKVLNPPVKGCIIAFIFGFTPFLQNWWVSKHFTAVLVVTAFELVGRCMVPCVLVTLGARVFNVTKDQVAEYRALRGKKAPGAPSAPLAIDASVGGAPVAAAPTSPSAAGSTSASLFNTEAVEVRSGGEGEGDADEMVELEVFNDDGGSIFADPLDVHNCPADERADAPLAPATTTETSGSFTLTTKLLIVFCRQVVLSGMGLLLVTAYTQAGVTDVMLLIVCWLQTAGPPMINLAIMAGLHGAFESDVASTLMLAYLFSVLSWSAGIASLLYILRLSLG
eukprot:Rhum_TRINITY_DN803_c0_g1::Rhum_TRINITY_DN803_c0_g1_i1::g.2449::m.2449